MRGLRPVIAALGWMVVLWSQASWCRANNLSTGRNSDAEMAGAYPAHAETENFAVFSFAGGPHARGLAERAEALRQQLQARWLGSTSAGAWRIRCQIVVHGAPGDYARAVGRTAAPSRGSSLIRSSRGAISYRRIDVLAAGITEPSALAHELAHVVLADRFLGQQPPRWLDEGVATLSDSDTKRALHRRDCVGGLQRGEQLPLVEILTSQQPRKPEQVAVFYGQSLTLVEFLIRRRDPGTLVDFAKLAAQSGYDAALRKFYGLDGIGELERAWRDEVLGTAGP